MIVLLYDGQQVRRSDGTVVYSCGRTRVEIGEATPLIDAGRPWAYTPGDRDLRGTTIGPSWWSAGFRGPCESSDGPVGVVLAPWSLVLVGEV